MCSLNISLVSNIKYIVNPEILFSSKAFMEVWVSFCHCTIYPSGDDVLWQLIK